MGHLAETNPQPNIGTRQFFQFQDYPQNYNILNLMSTSAPHQAPIIALGPPLDNGDITMIPQQAVPVVQDSHKLFAIPDAVGLASKAREQMQLPPQSKHDLFYKEPSRRVTRWEDDNESRRKSGWGEEMDKIFTPQTFSFVPPNYTINEFEIWIRRHRIDDLQKRIAMQDWESADADIRSPSPEPVYDAKTGLRMNTKEQRYKDKYVRERNGLIQEVLALDSTYQAPPDYKPPKKYKRIYIPDPDNPSINYIGQIIGPQGQTQQKLEKESRCKIQIRGRGSQSKSRIYNREEIDEDEPLYVLVTANNDEDLMKGVAMIQSIIEQTDENQKYQIAVYDHLYAQKKVWCESCGEQGHKHYECPDRLFGNTPLIYCQNCGSNNHPSSDCPQKKKEKKKMDDGITPEEELYNFLHDLKQEKENREKYKAITGKEAPRELAMMLAIQDDPNPPSQRDQAAVVVEQHEPAYPQYTHQNDYSQSNYGIPAQPTYAPVEPQIPKIDEPSKPTQNTLQGVPASVSNSEVAQELFKQQQTLFQQSQQTQVGAQSSYKSYKVNEGPVPIQPQVPVAQPSIRYPAPPQYPAVGHTPLGAQPPQAAASYPGYPYSAQYYQQYYAQHYPGYYPPAAPHGTVPANFNFNQYYYNQHYYYPPAHHGYAYPPQTAHGYPIQQQPVPTPTVQPTAQAKDQLMQEPAPTARKESDNNQAQQ